MDIKSIFEVNIKEYSDYIDDDVAENMGRLFFRGIAGHNPVDDSVLSMLIWELKSVDDDSQTRSELKWIYAIDPEYISPLLESYRSEALNENVKKSFFENMSLEKEKQKALRECSFSIEAGESKDINVTVGECRELTIAKKEAPSYIQSISGLDDMELYQGVMNILFKYDNPALEDLAYLPKEWYEQNVSCYIKTDGKVTGFLLVHRCPSGILVPVLFFAVGADSRISLLEMMRFSIRRAAEKYPQDTIIRIHRRNKEVKALSGKLFPDKKGEPAVFGERTEE